MDVLDAYDKGFYAGTEGSVCRVCSLATAAMMYRHYHGDNPTYEWQAYGAGIQLGNIVRIAHKLVDNGAHPFDVRTILAGMLNRKGP